MPKSASAGSEWGIIRLRKSPSDAPSSCNQFVARHFSDTLAFQVAGTFRIATFAEGGAQSTATHSYQPAAEKSSFYFLALTAAAACHPRKVYPAIIDRVLRGGTKQAPTNARAPHSVKLSIGLIQVAADRLQPECQFPKTAQLLA